MNRETAFNATHAEIREFARETVESIQSANADQLTTAEILEAEEHARQFSPNEEWIAGFNDRNDRDEAWETYEEELADAADDEGFEEGWILDRDQAEEMFCEALDEDGPVRIGTLEYSPSRVLAEVDPVAYREGCNDYINGLREDGYRVEVVYTP